MGFDEETNSKVTTVPIRMINDIANRKKLRESYRLHLRKFILDDAMSLSLTVMTRFEKLINGSGHNDCGDHIQCHQGHNVKDRRRR